MQTCAVRLRRAVVDTVLVLSFAVVGTAGASTQANAATPNGPFNACSWANPATQTTVFMGSVTTHTPPNGNWVGAYGPHGYSLLGWKSDGTSLSALTGSPAVFGATLAEGGNPVAPTVTTDSRALTDPAGQQRRFNGRGSPTILMLTLRVPAPNWASGNVCPWGDAMHFYVVDPKADAADTEQVGVDVTPALAPQTVSVSLPNLAAGQWLDIPLMWGPLSSGSSTDTHSGDPMVVTVNVTRSGPSGRSALLSGAFVGDASPPVQTPEAPMTVLMPVSAVAVGAAALWLRRRRRGSVAG